ncbi:MAG: hypothetical protein WC975_15880 [Phycisphaerae bacterium]
MLDRISTHPHCRIAELTPRGWKAALRTPRRHKHLTLLRLLCPHDFPGVYFVERILSVLHRRSKRRYLL